MFLRGLVVSFGEPPKAAMGREAFLWLEFDTQPSETYTIELAFATKCKTDACPNNPTYIPSAWATKVSSMS